MFGKCDEDEDDICNLFPVSVLVMEKQVEIPSPGFDYIEDTKSFEEVKKNTFRPSISENSKRILERKKQKEM